MNQIQDQNDIFNFWFVECAQEQWFKKDSQFDELLEVRFGDTVEQVFAGDLDSWSDSDTGSLALILVLDQFTRNIFRDTPRAFAGDQKALTLSFHCQERGYLATQGISQRHFMLLPMMHSEDLSILDASLPLFKELKMQNVYDYALKHRDIVARFGRFPHRNKILGRTSTVEELEFLTQPGSSF